MAAYQIRVKRLVLDRKVSDPDQIAGFIEAGVADRLNGQGTQPRSARGYEAEVANDMSARIVERLGGHTDGRRR